MSEVAAPADALLDSFCAALRARHGDDLLAIVLYGSYLRGERDTLPDFHVLLEDCRSLGSRASALANRLLPPNVYHCRVGDGDGAAAAKYATLTLGSLERAIARGFHPYFWARWAQPVAILHARDADSRARVQRAAQAAARSAIAATLGMLPPRFTTAELWQRAFALTYAAELRSEAPARAAEIARAYAPHLREALHAHAAGLGLATAGEDTWTSAIDPAARRRAARAWRARRVLGKLLSVARLLKGAFTFEDPLGYVMWKVARHTGVRVEASALQRRHPLLFSWPVLWRMYRLGGFR